MALTRLPTELLDIIITFVLPEGFESMALSCRRIYALCTSFIERHKRLCSQFQNFAYFEKSNDPSFIIRSAFDLITRIAVEPLVARYVRRADFRVDSAFYHHRLKELMADRLIADELTDELTDELADELIADDLIVDVHCDEAVTRLFANSPYLEQAGLDWKEYCAEIEEDLKAARYSQHAAAFLLTLLPNVKVLWLPNEWKPLDATDKLIDAVVRKAKQSHLSCDRPSLARITKFGLSRPFETHKRFDLDLASSFLALPHIRSFHGPRCVAMNDGHESIAPKHPYRDFGETLNSVNLSKCCIDEMGIADFLKHTTRLRKLKYSHSTNGNNRRQSWDICKFVTAIEREIGSQLEKLSISIVRLSGLIAPGEATMRNFKRLRKLEFPLDIAICNITAAARRVATSNEESPIGVSTNHELDDCEPLFIGDLVPASVSRLSLISRGSDNDGKALDLMFRNFAAKKIAQLPALEKIHLSFHPFANDAYKNQCARLLAATEGGGIVLDWDLDLWPYSVSIS